MRITFLADFELGHLFPMIGVAEELRAAGHELSFMAIADHEVMLKSAGFSTQVIFKDVYPLNSIASVKLDWRHLPNIIAGTLDPFLTNFHGVLIIPYFLSLEALVIKCIYPHIKIVWFTPRPRLANDSPGFMCVNAMTKVKGNILSELTTFLQAKIEGSDLSNIPTFLDREPELIATLPSLTPLSDRNYGSQVKLVGFCLMKRKTTKVDRVPRNLIYATIGSQGDQYLAASELFVTTMIRAMKTENMAQNNLVLSTGRKRIPFTERDVPSNLKIVAWVNQYDVLGASRAAVIHGGFGTIKECIALGVPMVIVPLGRDQFINASIVESCGAGIIVNLSTPSCELRMSSALDQVMNDPSYREKIVKLQNEMVQYAGLQSAAAAIQQIEVLSKFNRV
ncbi:MAG: hypothetical protein ING88_16200 [Cytophagales bacterium]|jgi:zeaxanthin glucosyltransferase|nr:hypothetical protein [Cytophagales bacterium]